MQNHGWNLRAACLQCSSSLSVTCRRIGPVRRRHLSDVPLHETVLIFSSSEHSVELSKHWNASPAASRGEIRLELDGSQLLVKRSSLTKLELWDVFRLPCWLDTTRKCSQGLPHALTWEPGMGFLIRCNICVVLTENLKFGGRKAAADESLQKGCGTPTLPRPLLNWGSSVNTEQLSQDGPTS